MIYISSKAGQRLAKAEAHRRELQIRHSGGEDCWPELRKTRIEVSQAAKALADELIEGRHHEAEGD